MTWNEIKKAVESAGIKETDDLIAIECERIDGDKKLHVAKSGKMIQLREFPDESKMDLNGCAV